MGWSRREFLSRSGSAVAITAFAGCSPGNERVQSTAAVPFPTPPAGRSPDDLAADASFWRTVASHYDISDEVIQLENGYWGMMPRSVLDAYTRNIQEVNRRNSYFARREYGRERSAVRDRVAAALGVEPQEIAFTRGATEALQNLIGGYNRLVAGDAVMYADLDYDSMQYAMEWLRHRRGVDVVKITLPEPASRQGILDTYAAALESHPRVRLLLLTHLSHRTGLVIPVAEIAELARSQGVDVIVDAAHSWGQMNFNARDLNAPFVGFNLHKWIGAPLGVGVLYIARDRIGDIDPFMSDEDHPSDDIRSRVHSGTSNFASYLTVPAALDFNAALGLGYKEARLKWLRDQWAEELRSVSGIDILTPDDPSMHAGITSFRLKGIGTTEDNIAIAQRLLDEFNIYTVHRTGVAAGACIRVTPSLFTSDDDVRALRDALRRIAA